MSSSYRRPMLVALALLLVLLTAGIGAKRLTETASSMPVSFVRHTCPFPIGTGAFQQANVRCGFLKVPENHQVAHGRTIKLAVAEFKSPASHPAADPFIYLVGGPGGSIVSSMGSRVASSGMPTYVGNRDLILVDQRGTGLSQPSLACPEFYAVGRGATKQPLTEAKLFSLDHQALQQCRARLVRSGVNLNAYNTVENAADIAGLWKALGYKQATVYGGSYGARLALQVMRDHPAGIRSVVMDAVADPTFNEYNDTIPHAWRSLQLVFKECAAAPRCRTTYPNLQTTFNQTVARLQAHPILGHEIVPKWGGTYPVEVHGARLGAILMGALYSPDLIPTVPGLIWNAAHGNYKLLFETDAAINSSNADSSEGMYLSMECSDEKRTRVHAPLDLSIVDRPRPCFARGRSERSARRSDFVGPGAGIRQTYALNRFGHAGRIHDGPVSGKHNDAATQPIPRVYRSKVGRSRDSDPTRQRASRLLRHGVSTPGLYGAI